MAVTPCPKGGPARRQLHRQTRQGRRHPPGRAHRRLLRHGLQAGIRRRGRRPTTSVFECHGVKVLIDPKSLPYMDGTELDFVREGLNEGFKFNNPNVKDRVRLRRELHRLSPVGLHVDCNGLEASGLTSRCSASSGASPSTWALERPTSTAGEGASGPLRPPVRADSAWSMQWATHANEAYQRLRSRSSAAPTLRAAGGRSAPRPIPRCRGVPDAADGMARGARRGPRPWKPSRHCPTATASAASRICATGSP